MRARLQAIKSNKNYGDAFVSRSPPRGAKGKWLGRMSVASTTTMPCLKRVPSSWLFNSDGKCRGATSLLPDGKSVKSRFPVHQERLEVRAHRAGKTETGQLFAPMGTFGYKSSGGNMPQKRLHAAHNSAIRESNFLETPGTGAVNVGS